MADCCGCGNKRGGGPSVNPPLSPTPAVVVGTDVPATPTGTSADDGLPDTPAPSESITTYFNADQTYTASCASGYSGNPVSVTIAAGAYEAVSQAEANALALAAATEQAAAALVCVPIYYNTSQSYTATCPSGYSGSPVTVTIAAATYNSLVSQAAVNATALAAAQVAAEAAIHCVTDAGYLLAWYSDFEADTPGLAKNVVGYTHVNPILPIYASQPVGNSVDVITQSSLSTPSGLSGQFINLVGSSVATVGGMFLSPPMALRNGKTYRIRAKIAGENKGNVGNSTYVKIGVRTSAASSLTYIPHVGQVGGQMANIAYNATAVEYTWLYTHTNTTYTSSGAGLDRAFVFEAYSTIPNCGPLIDDIYIEESL